MDAEIHLHKSCERIENDDSLKQEEKTMDTEFIKELAIGVNDVVIATVKPLQEQINELKSKLEKIRQAATKWPRCCDLWQDSVGGMHCTPCSQKTFSMLRNIQRILGVNKACEKLE